MGKHFYYSQFQIPQYGKFLVAVSDKGLGLITFRKKNTGQMLKELRQQYPEVIFTHNASKIKKVEGELKNYFSGKLSTFKSKIDLSLAHTDFQKKVLKLCAKIPYGKVLSYGELAKKAGSPMAARAVGGVMASNPIPIVVPCHRVIASNHGLGGYGGGLDVKKKLLYLEGAHL